MEDVNRGELFKLILSVAEKHPNTKLGKLIRQVNSEKTHKNIILLLIELAENQEFSCDTSVSLNYYLDLFEELPGDPSFSEAGLLLLNSAIIYCKRVDSIHLAVERLILSLINDEHLEIRPCGPNSNSTLNNTRRGKKRPFEQLSGPYETDVSVKRFKTLSNNKRFDNSVLKTNKKILISLKDSKQSESILKLSKSFIHPTCWKKSIIEDFDYDDEIDSKKNYRLFTYHLEHRYNTLIPDINFKMHFKMKDFIDAECNNSELWPPLSDAYINHCVNLENKILYKEGHDAINHQNTSEENSKNNYEPIRINAFDQQQEISLNSKIPDDFHSFSATATDNDISSSHANILESTSEHLNPENTLFNTFNESEVQTSISINESADLCQPSGESGISLTVYESTVESQSFVPSPDETHIEFMRKDGLPSTCDATLLDAKSEQNDLNTIKVILPHLDDEGVFFSELDERDHKLLSPAVVATDVFRCVKDKSNIVVIVDDVIKRIYNIQEPQQVISVPVYSCAECPSVILNILKIHHKYLKKRRNFKLGPEFHQLKKQRQIKCCPLNQENRLRSQVRLSEDVTGVPLTPQSSPSHEPDFYGFPENVLSDKSRTLSRDSGISLPQIDITSDRMNHDDFQYSKNVEDSREFERLSVSEKTLSNGEARDALGEIFISTQQSSSQFPVTNEISLLDHKNTLFGSSENCYKNNNDQVSSSKHVNLREFSENISKVEEWHAHLKPILAHSRERHHFDVFDLGTEIMSQFERRDMTSNLISLSQVMENKDQSLISRYFLSTLLLANQGNININLKNRSSDVPCQLNDVELLLLSKKRNIVTMEDNIGLQTSLSTIGNPIIESAITNIRTFKSIPTVPTTHDRDSGISMSETCSVGI